jgi:hypothetical protein
MHALDGIFNFIWGNLPFNGTEKTSQERESCCGVPTVDTRSCDRDLIEELPAREKSQVTVVANLNMKGT